MATIDTARELLALGLSVIPIPPPRPGVSVGQPGDGKVPALAWREYQTRFPTDHELVQWFSAEPMKLAIVTGELSGVVVIDADDRAAVRVIVRRLPYTPWQTKTTRGFHLFYRHPGVRVPNRARLETAADGRLAIDVRGDGGYVIAPTSMHASGTVYGFAGDWRAPRERIPRFWPGWLERPPDRPLTPRPLVSRPTGDVLERARRYLASIPRPEIGAGSDAAVHYAACRLVRGFALSATESEDLLWDWCGHRAGWTRAWVAAKVANAERNGTEPIGGLR